MSRVRGRRSRCLRLWLRIGLVLMGGPCAAVAQQAGETPPPQQERVDVVAPAPADGTPIDAPRFPGNMQAVTGSRIDRLQTNSLPAALQQSVTGLTTSDPQGNAFEPDVYFRGFEASPQLGAPQGLSVYQDGVRINDAFGDVVGWGLLPSRAVAGAEVVPGADPLYGRNSLGGSIAIRTKTGFDAPGLMAEGAGGSLGQRAFALENGGHRDSLGYYVAAEALDEDGWRQASPSRWLRAFASGSYRAEHATADVSVAYGAADLAGNGTVPVSLLESDRSAVLTRPDSSSARDALISARSRYQVSDASWLVLDAHARRTRLETRNGDLAEGDGEGTSGGDGQDRFTLTDETSVGGTAAYESNAPLAGRQNRFSAGGGYEMGRARYQTSVEFGSFDASRAFVGSGEFAADPLDLQANVTDAFAFLSEAWTPAPPWTVTLSARYDGVATVLDDAGAAALDGTHRVSRLNPSAGLTYETGKTVLYARWGQASRSPTPAEFACADPAAPCRVPTEFTSDPPLQQVVATTLEAGARGNLSFFRWSAALFRTTTRHDILFIASGEIPGEGYFANVGSTIREGAELGVDGRNGAWRWHVGYAWLHAVFDGTFVENSPDHPDALDGLITVRPGDRLPTLPAHTLQADVDFVPAGPLGAGLGLTYLSSEYLRGDEANRLAPIGPQCAVSLRLRYDASRNWSLLLRVDNLLDAKFATYGELGRAEPLLPDSLDHRFLSPNAPRRIVAGVRFAL